MKSIERVSVEIRPTFTIEEAAKDVIALCHAIASPILFEFNGVKIVAMPGDTIRGLVNDYYRHIPRSLKQRRGELMLNLHVILSCEGSANPN